MGKARLLELQLIGNHGTLRERRCNPYLGVVQRGVPLSTTFPPRRGPNEGQTSERGP
jgi:hypothetical protein